MRCLIISHEFPPIGGGGANACFYLTKEYAKCGHKVTIVTSSYKDLPMEETRGNIHIIRVKALRKKEEKSTFFEMLTYLCSAWHKISRILKDENYDICQVFFGIPSGPIGLWIKKKYHIPYIIRFGGGDIPGAQRRFSLLYKALTPFIRLIWKNADALVANSDVLMNRAKEFEKRYPIEIITNGVDSSFFSKGKKYFSSENIIKKEGQINVLFVSRLIKGKGLQYIIPQMGRINQECLQKIHLTIVGDGPYRMELEKIAKESKMSQYISFEGKKKKEELYIYYDQADLFILPSESEGMPNVVLEAMAMGLPIIMTPCGGSEELIHNNGYVVSIERFTDSIIALCNNTQKRNAMGKQSEILARTRFSWEEKAKEYIKIMEMCR
jgi:glycosyltransferase involved in cell wall biosynthesis